MPILQTFFSLCSGSAAGFAGPGAGIFIAPGVAFCVLSVFVIAAELMIALEDHPCPTFRLLENLSTSEDGWRTFGHFIRFPDYQLLRFLSTSFIRSAFGAAECDTNEE